MPNLTATLEADFSRFIAECKKAEKAMEGIQQEADKTGKGVSDSADKMGKGMQQSGDAMGTLKTAAGALGISLSAAFVVDKVVAFWQETLKTADAMQNVADQTGMTANQVARLSAVAEGAGLQVEDLAKASAKLQTTMQSDEGVTALGRLGIDARELKAADPYQQLLMVARGLGEVQDKSERLRLQQDLLGDGSIKLARVMNESFEDTATAARTASSESIAAVAALGNKFGEIGTTLKNFAIEGLGSVLRAVDDFKALDWKEILKAASLSVTTEEMIQNLRLLREQQEATALMSGGGPKPWMDDPSTWGGGPTREQLQAAAAARKKLEEEQAREWEAWERQEDARVKKVAEATAEINEARQGSVRVLGTLTSAERAAAQEALGFGISQEKVALALDLTGPQVKAVADELDRMKKATEDLKKANEIFATAAGEHYSEMAGQAATSLQQQTLAIGTWRAKAMADLAATGQASMEQYEGIARMAEEKLAGVGINWDTLKAGSIQTLRDQYTEAEKTYQKMFQNSSDYTRGAIENAQKERDARLAALQAAEGAHSQMFTAWLEREKAYATAVKQFDAERAGAQGKSIDDQTAAMDKAIAYAQAYGVSLAEAQKALGQVTDAGTQGMNNVAAATGQAVVQMNNLAAAASTAYERAIAGANLMRAYSDAGVAMSGSIGMGGYEFDQLKRTGVPGGLASMMWARPTPDDTTTPWGKQTTLNVNVNSTEAGDIASKLVTEMRHSGVKL